MMKDQDAVKRIVEETVRQTLATLGLDHEDLKGHQADMLYLRQLRLGSEEISKKFISCLIKTTVTGVLTAIGYALWEAFKFKTGIK